MAGALGGDFPPAVNIAFEVMAKKGYAPTELTSSQILEVEGVTQSERLGRSGVELFEVNREIPGLTDLMPNPNRISGFGDGTGVAEYFEVVSMEVDGETMRFARAVPPEEIGRRKVAAGDMTPDEFADGLDAYSDGQLAVGAALREEMPFLRSFGGVARHVDDTPASDAPTVMQSLGMSMSVRDACGAMARGDEFYTTAYGTTGETQTHAEHVSNSWVSPDPLTFLTGPACALKFGAEVMRATDLTDEQKKAAIAKAREATNDRIQLTGREEVDGRPTYRLEMHDLNVSQTTEDGAQIDFNSAAVWIDEEYFVRRKMRMEGMMHAEGESREFFFESLNQDYRNVPGSHLYEPYRTVLRTGGMITPEQQREMQAAMAQLEDYERQMASMPASQRAMVERMMGDKIEQARSLATGGAVKFELITTSLVINPDFSGAPSLLDDGPELVRTIQQGLTMLGYDPGPVTGQMNQQTAVAIVRFESDRGMEVTGQATPALSAAIRSVNR
jgi:hypothetical protein